MNYQLESVNESGQEVIGHLQDTAQDPSPVVHKVDGINSQWDQLQARLRELRNHVKDKVSPERIRFLSLFFFERSVQVSFVAGVLARKCPI